ncbi:MAG: flagellar biosynthesis protein FlhF [Lachnospiraceae bacterium]|nr:flagellar biosynthesis protein FlhF [Lachnospiraceae bacterium]
MIIKKYLAKSEKDAIEMAKQDLGNAAIVMNIKKVHPKGLSKIFVRSKVEVTAALDENPVYEEKTKQPVPEQKEPAFVPVKKPEEKEQSLQDKLMRLQALLEKQMEEKEAEKEKKESTEPPKEKADQESVNENETVQKTKETEDEKTAACKELIYKQLLQNEVDEKIATSIMEEVNRSLPRKAALDQILASVYQKIILMLGQPYLIDAKPAKKTKFIFFLGSTGVGKTTTIAKIASKLKLEKEASIALVTADTYRIAAVEQLKTYANILSVPLKVVYSQKDLEEALEELAQYDICLIDTAGRSHKNAEQIEDIRNLLEQVPVSERQVYLVLNAGTKYNDLKEIASVYSKLTDFSIIFTKLDETSCAGAMLNMRVETKCPLSYVTWGQNVPDDIGEVDAQRIAKKLLSGEATK